jgi:hypothetical protein
MAFRYLFFRQGVGEDVMANGATNKETADALQAAIVAAGYGK